MPDSEQQQTRQTAPTSYSCPTCGMPMRIALVEPDGPDHESRTFDCIRCKVSKTVRIKYG